ncbi:MAG: universal stress protein [Eggerthella lenta]
MGNRGLSGLKEYMGSVSHKLLHASPIPVLIAK